MTRRKDSDRQGDHLVAELLNLPLFQNHRAMDWTVEDRQDIKHTVDELWNRLSERATSPPAPGGGLKPGAAQSLDARYHAEEHAQRQPHQRHDEASNDR